MLTVAASSASLIWQMGRLKEADLTKLQAHADIVRALVAGAWPDASQRPAVAQTTEAAVQTARRAHQAAKERAEKLARIIAVTAALTKLRDDAASAAAAWQDRPPSQDEWQMLEAAHTAAQAMVAASPDPTTHRLLLKEEAAAVAAARAAKERAEKQARNAAVRAALTKLRDDAASAAAAWQHRPPTDEEMKTLEAAHTAAQAMVAASPDPSAHTALSAQVTAAVAAARAAKETAELDEQRATVEAALIALTGQAMAAAAAWQDRPPSVEEREAFNYEIATVSDLLTAHNGVQVPEALQQAQQACRAAWAAADAAAAAQAERRRAAEQALVAFTQRALLYAARWGRKGRRQPPKEQKYAKLVREYDRVLGLVQREYPAAYALLRPMPQEEAHVVTMLQEADVAEALVKRVVEAWRYAAAMHGGAVAA